MAVESVGNFKLSNERLEYLGDAVLSAIIAEYLFKMFPTKSEGFLTEMRSRIVSRNSLNKLSLKLGLDDMIHYTRDGHSKFRSVGGDAFEAFVGAIFLDRGYRFTRKIVIERIVKVHIDLDTLEHTDVNFKSKILEWAQKEKRHIEFKILGEKGEGYHKLYIVQIFIDGVAYQQAADHSIKGAEQLAAEKTWLQMHETHKAEQQS